MILRRHDLAQVSPAAEFDLCCAAADAALSRRLATWIGDGLPLVVPRQSENPESVVLALTLPAAEGRRRLSATFPRRALLQVHGPLGLAQGALNLPAAQQRDLLVLEFALRAMDIRVGLYGSLAWETLTGQTYRHNASDIDLIVDVADSGQIPACLHLLGMAAKTCRVDGEIRLPGGDAVAWQELRRALAEEQAEVLVKGDAQVRLMALEDFLASGCCHA